MRIMAQCIEIVLIGQPRVPHPLTKIPSFVICHNVLDKGPRRDNMSGSLVDVEFMWHGRFECVGSPVFRPPHILHPVDVSATKIISKALL